jgi:hypothetical protein
MTRKSSNTSKRPRRAQLGVEILEDRCVPAIIDVIGLGDGAGQVTQTAPGMFSATTLRAAMSLTNTDGNATDTINLMQAGTYKLLPGGTPNESDNAAGELAYTGNHNLLIQNASGGMVTVQGNGLTRVFDVNPGAQNTTPFTVTFQGFTISGGVAAPGDADQGSGGGIRAQGAASIVLNDVVLSGNSATADGGGIALESLHNDSIGTLTITNSIIANNSAGDAGGGVETDGTGLVAINYSTIAENVCVNQGAGVWLDAGGASLTMTGAVVENNQATTMLAGGIGNAGAGNVTLVSCTIEDNFSGGTGGGFGDAANTGTLTVRNSFFLNNKAVGNGGPPSTASGDGHAAGRHHHQQHCRQCRKWAGVDLPGPWPNLRCAKHDRGPEQRADRTRHLHWHPRCHRPRRQLHRQPERVHRLRRGHADRQSQPGPSGG